MATPTTIDTDTELSAVNSILGAIGQAPVTTLGTITETIGEQKYTGDTTIAGTYARSGTTVTVTDTAHGLVVDDAVTIDFTSPSSGAATDGEYTVISVPSADTFTVTDSATGTIGAGETCTYGKRNYPIVSSFSLSHEIKCSLDGVVTTAFSISGTDVVFDTAPATSVVVRIYREREIANTLANPEVSFIYNLLTEVNKDVQNEGWICNTERHVKVSSDDNNHIEIPANYLRYDAYDGLTDRTLDTVRRKKNVSGTDKYLLYDLVDHTYEFTNDLYLDIVYLWPYEDLPNVFKRYITYRAAVRAATQLVSNPQLVQLLQTQEAMTRAAVVEYECNQGDHSFFGLPHDSRYNSYKPYYSLRR